MRLAAAIFGAAALLAGCAEPTVVRNVDGRLVEGRFVSPLAYTLYAIGAEAEARGDLRTALAAYQQALDDDAESPDLWTRVGAVRCRTRRPDDANAAFDRALAADPDYEPAWRERARCALAHGQLDEALRRADQAILLDPDRPDGVLLRVEILERLGRRDDALRALRALTVRYPHAVEAWEALYRLALGSGRQAAAEEAAKRLRALAPRHAEALAEELPAMRPLAELDAALARGDLPAARRLALAVDLPPAELAVRAAALGRSREARDQAELVSGADPSSASAWIALLAAADLAGDDAALAKAWAGLPAAGEPMVPPSPLARLVLAEVLARRVGRDAATAWLGAAPDPAGRADALEAALAKRVAARLGGGK